jgi:GNAT superfamily N-acetyltransferase
MPDPAHLEGPLGARPEDGPALLALINRVFTRNGSNDMGGRFPVLWGPDNLENCRIFVEGDRPVAHVGTIARDAVLGGPRTRISCVGCVGTDPDYRGHGLATRLLDDAETRMRHGGVDIVMISGGRGLYKRRGARAVGRWRRFTLSADAVAAFADHSLEVRLASPYDAPTLAGLYQTKPARFERTLDDWTAHLSSGQCECSTAVAFLGLRDGRPAAYIAHKAWGKLSNPISDLGEWAGPAGDVLALAAAAVERAGRPEIEIKLDPAADPDLAVRVAERAGEGEACSHGATFKVLRPAALYEACRPHLSGPARTIGVSEFETPSEDGGVNVGAGFELGGTSIELPVEQVARLFFGDPGGDLDERLRAAGDVGAALLDAFPFPVPRYGYSYA